jgi:hypothetical protein
MRSKSWNQTPLYWMILLFISVVSFTACDDEDDPVTKRTFHVTIQNVSNSTTLQVGALPDRTAPLSAGVWGVVEEGNIFDLNQESSVAIERLAEEGSTTLIASELSLDEDIAENGVFSSDGGPDNGPLLATGETVTFSFDADPGDRLQIMTMFGNSNDWFYAFGNGGLDLFNGDVAISGDQTSKIVLYDAGTELDEMPGLGLTQKPDHPTTIDIGPADPVDMITNAMTRHTSFTIPATNGVLKVTVTSEE